MFADNSLKTGSKLPVFDLPGIDGKNYSLESFKSKGIQFIAINSNDEENYPEDNFENMVKRAKEKKYNFPYLRDKTQEVAKVFGASFTPEIFVFDEHKTLQYHGRIDDSPKDPAIARVTDLRNAVDAVLHDRKVAIELTHAIGCSIKWK